ncbi:sugar ABC transporter permease [bacterium]|nr:sugar ABC transporter permease [bacterium]|tara:strand:- start:7055 stop:7816 length:762 start_codon:yes stop_codon:yes gene_type:complete
MNLIGLQTIIRREMERTFRVAVQTIFSPVISATLFIFVFGSIVGTRIDEIGGVSYITFVFPGILIMNVLTSAFTHSSSSVYFAKFVRSIEEMLVAPLSYFEIMLGYVISAVFRALIVGITIVLIGILFGAVVMQSFPLFFAYIIGTAVVFSLLGIITGLVAKSFEQLNILSTFIILPFSFLGGMFYTLEMLPEVAQTVTLFNPFFYFVDGIRYAMVGINDSNLLIGAALIFGLVAALGGLVWRIFYTGWRIRE